MTKQLDYFVHHVYFWFKKPVTRETRSRFEPSTPYPAPISDKSPEQESQFEVSESEVEDLYHFYFHLFPR
jgi:hypothetical protein